MHVFPRKGGGERRKKRQSWVLRKNKKIFGLWLWLLDLEDQRLQGMVWNHEGCELDEQTLANEDDNDVDHSLWWSCFFFLDNLMCSFVSLSTRHMVIWWVLVHSGQYQVLFMLHKHRPLFPLSSLLLSWKWMLCDKQGEQHMTCVWYTKLVWFW